jgi:Ycf66 protein N-terminus
MGFAFPAALLFGLVLIIASLSLLAVSKVKPNLYEESDNIYVGIGIVCGLLLLISLELSAAMAFQQLLLLSATITLMWRFINLRAETRQHKNRQSSGAERPKAYNARLEDDYVEISRERRQGKRRRSLNYDDDRDSRTETLRERRILGDSRDTAIEYNVSDRRNRSFDAEDLNTVDEASPLENRYDNRQQQPSSRRRSDWEDETDWNDSPSPRTLRRALPDADGFDARAERRTSREDEAADRALEPRELRERESARRRARGGRTDVEGTMSGYVDYEPIIDVNERASEPPSELSPSGSEPIVFPDRY